MQVRFSSCRSLNLRQVEEDDVVLLDLQKPETAPNFQQIFAREREIEAILADFDEEWMYELESHECFDRALNRIKSIPNWQ